MKARRLSVWISCLLCAAVLNVVIGFETARSTPSAQAGAAAGTPATSAEAQRLSRLIVLHRGW